MKPTNEDSNSSNDLNVVDHDIDCCNNDDVSQTGSVVDNTNDHDDSPKVTFFVENDDSSLKDEEIEIENIVKKAPDGGWGWFVVLGCHLQHIIIGGFERSDGVLFLKLMSKFNGSASATSWVCSLSSTIRLMMGPFASAMCNRFTSRYTTFVGALIFSVGVLLSGFASSLMYLYFTYGVIGGIGRSLSYTPGLLMVGLYFDKKRGLASGLGSAGVGIGTFILPLTFEVLFEEYDFFGAFLILSSIPLNMCVCAMLFRPLHVHHSIIRAGIKKNISENTALRLEEGILLSPSVISSKEMNTENTFTSTATQTDPQIGKNFLQKFYMKYIKPPKTESKQKKLIEFSLLKIPSFLFFCIGIAIFTASFKSAFTFLPALAKANGCTEREAALVMSITGIVDTVSRICSGFLLELGPIKPFRPVIYNMLMFIIVLVTFLCPQAEGFLEYCLIGSAYGLLTGGYISQKSVIIVDILGADKISHSFGLMIFFQGLGTLVGPPLSGLLRDIFGSYDEVFYLGGGLMFVASLVMIMSNVCHFLQLKKEQKQSTDQNSETDASNVSHAPRKSLIS